MPVEGFSRERILRELLQQGWVRIRYKPREDSFTMQLFTFDKRARSQLKKWTGSVTKEPENVSKHTGYELSEIKAGGKVVCGILKDLL
jgi:hypothetical protein